MSRKVLVAYASRMGGTEGIAEAVGTELRRCGHEVDVRAAASVDSLAEYDVVVLGSAIYARRWRPAAVRFLRRFATELRLRQVWLFHSGPDKAITQEPPPHVRRLIGRIDAAWPITFAGRLEQETARGLLARWLARGELAGDFRDWDDRIASWAHDIHDAIAAVDASHWWRHQRA